VGLEDPSPPRTEHHYPMRNKEPVMESEAECVCVCVCVMPLRLVFTAQCRVCFCNKTMMSLIIAIQRWRGGKRGLSPA